MNNIIIMSYSFFPDISPAAFRIKALVESMLNNKKFTNFHIVIVSSNPKRYKLNYKLSEINFEKNNITIFRSKNIKFTNTGIDSVLSYLNYMILCFSIFLKYKKKVVIVTSSKLGTAFVCFIFSFFFNYQYMVDIRDILSDNISSIIANFNKFLSKIIKKTLLFIEKKILINSFHVNVVTDEFKNYYLPYLDVTNWTNFKNGIDDIFLNTDFKKTIDTKKINILYVGNNGVGQALDKIIPIAALNLNEKYEFTIIGNGSNHKKLQDKITNLNLRNIIIKGALSRDEVIKYYKNTDILFIHLNNLNSFKKVLPSKIFEYIAVGKPIIAGFPDGYASKFISNHINHCVFFKSCDPYDFLIKLENCSKIKINKNQIEDFKIKFSRNSIMKNMTEDIFLRLEKIL